MATANNDRFLRFWFEISYLKIGFNMDNRKVAKESGLKWFPYNKGGAYRKWYGNMEYVVNWENDGEEVKEYIINRYPYLKGNYSFVIKNEQHYFKEGLTWSDITSSAIALRKNEKGVLFSDVGNIILPNNIDEDFLHAYLNTKLLNEFKKLISSTFHFKPGNMENIPIITINDAAQLDFIKRKAQENIEISKSDWDSFETSWGFKKHPFIEFKLNNEKKITTVFKYWKKETKKRFQKIKENETIFNKYFIELYELQNELTPEVPDEDITIYKAERLSDAKSFLSYFIGCVMGRYSLDIEGLAYAGGEFDESKYKTFKPNQDGLILITDDHYFENDIIVHLREFLSVAFSPDTVDENLRWLAESLKMKKNESPEERLRRYFLDEFFKDHCKTYQKRPIYWLVDSGKQKGLRTLIYMHRYQPDTMATIRFDHLQEIQAKYQNEIEMIDTRLANPSLSATDRRNLEKAKISYKKKIEELQEFDKHLAVYANEPIEIDLDDGVKVNYAKFDKVLAKIK